MVTVAVRVQAEVGMRVGDVSGVQTCALPVSFVQVVPAAMAKSPGFEPARAMLVMLRGALPLFPSTTSPPRTGPLPTTGTPTLATTRIALPGRNPGDFAMHARPTCPTRAPRLGGSTCP